MIDICHELIVVTIRTLGRDMGSDHLIRTVALTAILNNRVTLLMVPTAIDSIIINRGYSSGKMIVRVSHQFKTRFWFRSGPDT